jgi:myo-inositol 2-dehydrogenase / D-chiro-inositol 1-dehydrogenase
MLRLGLLGCGEHAAGGHAVPLARYAAGHPAEIKLTAACDIVPARAIEFCRKYGFARAYTRLEEMLAAERLDACISVMPMEQIASVGIELLRAALPCVIEKPLGVTLAEARALLAAAEETGTPHMVSVNRRFMPYLRRARAWAKETGRLRFIRCAMIRHARSERDFIWSTAIHAVDALRYLAGEVSEFHLQTQQGGGAAAARWYAITLRFTSGVLGRIDVLPTAGAVEETYELLGDSFRALVTAPFGPVLALRCWRENRLELEETAPLDTPADMLDGSYNEVVAFVGALRAGRDLRPAIKDVFPSVQLCFQLAELAGCVDGQS